MRTSMKSPRVLAFLLALSLAPALQAQEKKPGPSAAPKQKSFATAREASDALVAAAESFDTGALADILGPDGESLVVTGDAVQDKTWAAEFAAAAKRKSRVEVDPKNAARATFLVGEEEWPLPIPIVKKGGKWRFHSAAGHKELAARRIGRNELDAIELCRGYVEAQREYSVTRREGSALNQYAQRILSTPGKQDGLAWKNSDGTWGGPVGETIARSIEEGHEDRSEPYHGYYFKVLKGQGPAARLGEMDFVVKGKMIGGFALVAAPAEWGVSGVKSFIVSHEGVVYEKDLGKKTLELFRSMERFNPDKSWSPLPEN